MKKTLRRPENWQDFETLCKNLWGEIWNCPEIKKNGRPGDQQFGVDVYGVPENQTQYYGIQCKGKDEYTDKQFTAREINQGIEQAKTFDPPLKKLYLATTAVKNSAIEALVRKKNLENIVAGLFEVHLYSWEDIVDLIDQNRNTLRWYEQNQNFKVRQSVDVTFHDGSKEITLRSKYKRTNIQYLQKAIPADEANFLWPTVVQPITFEIEQTPFFAEKTNHSFFKFSCLILNNGNDPIEHYKLLIELDGNIEDMKLTNKSGQLTPEIGSYTTSIYPDNLSAKFVPDEEILVKGDQVETDDIFLKPSHDCNEIELRWKLISKDFQADGELKIKVKVDVKTEYKNILVSDPLKAGSVKEGEIEDYVVIEA